jgi:hypothetical protein
VNVSLLDGLRVQFQNVLTALSWLLTWSDFGDDYEEDDAGYDDAGAN